MVAAGEMDLVGQDDVDPVRARQPTLCTRLSHTTRSVRIMVIMGGRAELCYWSWLVVEAPLWISFTRERARFSSRPMAHSIAAQRRRSRAIWPSMSALPARPADLSSISPVALDALPYPSRERDFTL